MCKGVDPGEEEHCSMHTQFTPRLGYAYAQQLQSDSKYLGTKTIDSGDTTGLCM